MLACAPMTIPLVSFAEEGVRATLGISNRLEAVSEEGYSEPEKEGVRFVTGLDFGLTTENSYQRLGIFANTNLAYNSNTDVADQFDIEDPSLRLTYKLESRQSVLDITASYLRADVDSVEFYDAFLDEDIETGEGKRTNVTLRTGLVVGRDAPVTLSLDHSYARNTYSDGAAANNSDNTTHRVGADLAFWLSPVTRINTFGNWRQTTEDGTDTTRQSLGIGASHDAFGVLTLSGSVSYDEETSTDSSDQEYNGLSYALGVDRELPNGSVSLDLARTETVNGARDQLTFGHAMALKRGNLNYSLGLARTEGTRARPLANLAFSYDLSKTSQFNISIGQSADVDSDDEETIRTRLNLGYTLEINEISSLSANANFAGQNAVDDDGTDSSTLSAVLTYRHEVGADWDMVTGYRYTSSRQDDRDDRNSSTIFVGLEKNFDWRP